MCVGKEAVYLFLKVIGRGRGTESDACHIFLVMVLQLLGKSCGLPDAYEKHSGGERVQGACMADLEVLFPEVTYCLELDFPDDVC